MDETTTEARGIKRIRQACQNCRRKKTRCSGERPICSFCARLGQECTYDTNDDHRCNGTSHADTDELAARIAMLESRLMEMNNFGSQDATSCASLDQNGGFDTHGFIQDQRRERRASSDAPSTTHRKAASILGPEMARIIEGSAPARKFKAQDAASAPLHSLSLPSPAPLSIQLSAADTYFERCHNQPYCYFAERPFRRQLADGQVPSHLVFAFLATAARFSEDPALKSLDEETIDRYAKKAWSEILQHSLASDEPPAAVHLVQTTNLLAVIDFTAGRLTQGWIKIGLAIRFAQELHMTAEPDCGLSPTEREERRRVFWSVYLLDKLVSCGRNRPIVFRDEDCRICLPNSEMAFRGGETQSCWTLQRVLEGSQIPDPKPDHFAVTVLAASCLGRAARYMLQQRGDEQYPPWSNKSDFAAITSALWTIETCMNSNGQSISEYVQNKLTTNGAIDQQRCGHLLYSHMLFHLSHVLLNHPFLMKERLKGLNRPTPESFLRESLQRCQAHAEELTSKLEQAIKAGCYAECSFYGFCAVVAGSIHCLNVYHESSTIRQRSASSLRSSFAFLKSLRQTWRHYPRLFEALVNVYASAEAMARQTTPTVSPNWLHLAAFDSAVWWHAVDYSSLCDAKSSSASSPASSGPMTSRSETMTCTRPDDARNGNAIVGSEDWIGSYSHPGAPILPDTSAQAVQTPNGITEFDLLFSGDYADPVSASDMLWNYVMNETSDIPGVAMPFDSPYWKDLSCHGL